MVIYCALQFKVAAEGVIEDKVLLQTLKFALPLVGYGIIVNMPVANGEYPVNDVGSPLNAAVIICVVAIAAFATVTTDAQAPEEIADVPNDAVPLATVLAPTDQLIVIAPGVIDVDVLLQTFMLT